MSKKKIHIVQGGRTSEHAVPEPDGEPKTLGIPCVMLQDHLGNKQIQSMQHEGSGPAVVSVVAHNAQQVWNDFWPKYLAWDAAKVIAELENARQCIIELGKLEERTEVQNAVLEAALTLVDQYEASQASQVASNPSELEPANTEGV